MIWTVPVDGTSVRVAPNRSLKAYLNREVNRVAQAKSIKLRQLPQSIVESGESVYLGRVARRRGDGTRGPELARPAPVASVADVARLELGRATATLSASTTAVGTLVVGGAEIDRKALQETAARSGFDASVGLVERAKAPGHFQTETGVSVNGIELKSAIAAGLGAELVTPGGLTAPALVRFHASPQPVVPFCPMLGQGLGPAARAGRQTARGAVAGGGSSASRPVDHLRARGDGHHQSE
jgi:hypothetical protein